MAGPDEHIARAQANEQLAVQLKELGELNWAVTAYFYAVVHHAGALLARSGIDPETLDHITTSYKLDKHHPAVTQRYLSLQGMSRRARYLPTHEADEQTVRIAARVCREVRDYQERVMRGEVPGV